jgi:hypothetical protein
MPGQLAALANLRPSIGRLGRALVRDDNDRDGKHAISGELAREYANLGQAYFIAMIGVELFLVLATIFADGALITSVGLARAVWIKRQSRAIAMSVGSFILVTAAWPIFVSISICSGLGRDLAFLSPVAACSILVTVYTSRMYAYVGGMLWWGAFWAVEVFVLAMGILWLTVRTFDGCVDRISHHPHRAGYGRLSLPSTQRDDVFLGVNQNSSAKWNISPI